MSKPFVYDEKTSSLYSPDGEFIKTIFCPKALNWNQLIANDSTDRLRGCQQCSEEVINLDAMSIDEALLRFSEDRRTCAHASSNSPNVIFIKDLNNPELRKSEADKPCWSSMEPIPDLPRIATARTYEDIRRAVNIGFWPDIRVVQYKDQEIKEKICLFQHSDSGEIRIIGDFRSLRDLEQSPEWKEVIPVTFYYSNYQRNPFAAYLIPKDLPDGSKVFIPDPIEDMVGSTWNQGDRYRAINLTGTVINKTVVIDPLEVKQSNFVG